MSNPIPHDQFFARLVRNYKDAMDKQLEWGRDTGILDNMRETQQAYHRGRFVSIVQSYAEVMDMEYAVAYRKFVAAAKETV